MLSMSLAVFAFFFAGRGSQELSAIEFPGMLEFELSPDDPKLDGHGPSHTIEWTAAFLGDLSLWVEAQGLDPFLRVEAKDGRTLVEDDDSGGGVTPWALIAVEPGTRLTIRVAAQLPSGPEVVALVARTAPSTPETLAACARAEERCDQIGVLVEQGRRLEATASAEALVEELNSVPHGSKCRRINDALWEVGQVARRALTLSAASRAYARVYAHFVETLPEGHSDIRLARTNLGAILFELGELEAARELQERTLEILEREREIDDPDLINADGNLALTLAELGDLPRAILLHERVLAFYSRTLDGEDLHLQRVRMNHALMLESVGQRSRARALLEQVLEVRSRRLSAEDPDLQTIRMNIAMSLLEETESDERQRVKELLEGVLEARSRSLPDDHPHLRLIQINYARLLWRLSEPEQAIGVLETMLEELSPILPEGHPHLRALHLDLVAYHTYLGDRKKALKHAENLARGISIAIFEAITCSSAREIEEFYSRRAVELVWLLSFCIDAPGESLEETGKLVD